MEKQILVNVDDDETRAAILEEGRLVEVFVDRPLNESVVGNIYLGEVENVLPGMQAAFVDIGMEKNAFLYVDDAYPGVKTKKSWSKHDSPAINDLLRRGQSIVVQVTKEATGTKGPRVTRNLTIPGRYLVLMPTESHVGVSRRIEDEDERSRLKGLAYDVKPDKLGVIVRTVAEGKRKTELKRDVNFLLKVWSDINSKMNQKRAPAVLHEDLDLAYRILRDYFTEEVDNFYVNSRREHGKIMDFLDAYAPDLKNRVHLYQNHRLSLFEKYGVNEQIEQALKRKVWLDCGGHLIIDQTEALTSIDVNTGKFVGSKELEDTVFKTNLEAAEEIGRQLRLRDIGGIIIIDFIDMEVRRHRRRVVRALEKSLAKDRTKATVLGITQLGLVEMTRKKGRKNLQNLMTQECPYCDGQGRVMSVEAMSRRARREIKRILRHSDGNAILVEVHPSVASLLIGAGGQNLEKLEKETGKSIYVKGSEDCHLEDVNVKALGDKGEVEKKALPVDEGQVLQLEVEEPHAANSWDGIARIEGYVVDIEGAGDLVGEKVEVRIQEAHRTYAKAKIV